MSPVERAATLFFCVKRGEITGRIDVNYWRLTPLFRERFKNPNFPVVKLGQLVKLVQYGCSKLATAEEIGYPMLRMNNLQNDGWDLSDLKYIVMNEKEFETYRLQENDLLFNRTNSKELVGKCEVFHEAGNWVFASYLIRVRLNASEVNPQFVSDFLSTNAGRLQINRLSRQIIGMTNINAEELKDISIPLPSPDIQYELVAAMDAARASRQSKLAKAITLLTSLDNFLLDTLDLAKPPKDDRKVFAVRCLDAKRQGRLNSDYFHPERILALRTMEDAADHLECRRLEEVVEFIRKQIKTPGPNYLGLANIQSHTGELAIAYEESSGACSVFKCGDVLFARLRPYLNKVYRTEMDGCCSPEFHVMRIRNDKLIRADYLAAVLRSSLILAQTRHMMTGNTHPRLTNEDVVNLIIPIPKPDIQENIVAEIRRRRGEARRLRIEAEDSWNAAKYWFEEQLLGDDQS